MRPFLYVGDVNIVKFNLNEWNDNNYNLLVSYLHDISDEKYRQFNIKIVPTEERIIGVRIPLLRKIAKDITSGNWTEFLRKCKYSYYEEIMLAAIVIGLVKVEEDQFMNLVKNFISHIDNWAVCDTFCAGLKLTNKYKEQMWTLLTQWVDSNNQWKLRFVIVMMLNYYIDDLHVFDVLNYCDKIQSEAYYVKMAQAWLISCVYIKYNDIGYEYMRRSKIDRWTYNKAIQKIVDSYRVSDKQKAMVKQLRS